MLNIKAMEGKPRWEELCRQASVEQDPEKLMELVKEINRLLEQHERFVHPAEPDAVIRAVAR